MLFFAFLSASTQLHSPFCECISLSPTLLALVRIWGLELFNRRVRHWVSEVLWLLSDSVRLGQCPVVLNPETQIQASTLTSNYPQHSEKQRTYTILYYTILYYTIPKYTKIKIHHHMLGTHKLFAGAQNHKQRPLLGALDPNLC